MSESNNIDPKTNNEPGKEEVETPKKDQKFSFIEPIVGIIFAVVCTVIFLWFSQIITVVFVGGRLIPTFDADVISSLWLPVILWGLLHITVDVFYLVERRYTKRLALIAVIGKVLTLICACIIFIPYRIVFWEYIDFINTYYANIAEWFGNILIRPNLIILFVLIIIAVLESAVIIMRGNKAKEKDDTEDKAQEANS